MATATTEVFDTQGAGELVRAHLEAGRAAEAADLLDELLVILDSLQRENNDLALKLKLLLKERSGKRTERIDPGQLKLMLEQLGDEKADAQVEGELDASEPDDEAEVEATPKRRRKGHGRKPLPKDLPREVFEHELPEADRVCPCCDEPMPKMGYDASEVLEFRPAQLIVHAHRRAKYACPRCKEMVKTAPGPDKVIDKGLPGPGLLAQVALSKYGDHTPLERQKRIYARSGVELPTSTLCDWVGHSASLLEPLAKRLHDLAMAADLIQIDSTGLKVLDPNSPENIRKGTIWCYIGDRRYAVVRYARTGSGGEGPWRYLAGREGYIQADAANIFDRLFNGQAAGATEVGCWAHARRKFVNLADSDARAAVPIELIRKLYRIESEADEAGLDATARLALRQRRSKKVTNQFRRWLLRTAGREPPRSGLAKAIGYSLNQWNALTRFLEDGRLGLDNNLCELQLRAVALGRKNYLFAGSDAGAHRAAVHYTVLRTCALNGVEPWAYLTDVLPNLAADWPSNRLDELLPDRWKAARNSVSDVITEPESA